MLAKTQDNEEIIERVAALDIGKAEPACCVRVPEEDRPGGRLQEVQAYATMTRSLWGMAGRLACLGVTRVVMEATSDCRKPVFYLLEAAGFETWLDGAKDVKHLPGRPKTGRLDCIWLCKVAERQMIRPGFVPPPPVRRLRDLTRYRAGPGRGPDRGEEPGGEAAAGRADQARRGGVGHLRRLRAGHARRAGRRGAQSRGAGAAGPAHRAQEDHRAGGGVHRLLHRSPRLPAGPDAGPGGRHHRRYRRARHQDRGRNRPFAAAVAKCDEVPGISLAAAHAILAETGLDMARFPAAGHLVSWAKYAPGVSESAGKKKGKNTAGHGNTYLARVLGNAAAAAGRTDTFLGERCRRIARRRGATKANVAIGRSILVIIWHLLSDPDARLRPRTGLYAARTDPDRRKHNHIRQLEALGYTVTLEPAA